MLTPIFFQVYGGEGERDRDYFSFKIDEGKCMTENCNHIGTVLHADTSGGEYGAIAICQHCVGVGFEMYAEQKHNQKSKNNP